MKKLAAILCLSALTTGAFAQGLVAFANQPGTQISSGAAGNTAAISGAAGSYYFGLLTSATGTAGSFTFANFYGTNSGSLGRIAAHTGPITGWAAGASMFYEVAGWSASLGTTFDPSWLTKAPNAFPANGFFGVSAVGNGTAGGGSPVPAPAWNLFGGSGLTGFNLSPVTSGGVVPEPTSMALAGLGAAALLIFRRRK